MSDQTDEQKAIEEAKFDYSAFLKKFNKKHGYGIGSIPEPYLDAGGVIRVRGTIQLIKLPTMTPPPKKGVDTTPNGDNATETPSAGNSEERDASETPE